jgi:hypothetical protein
MKIGSKLHFQKRVIGALLGVPCWKKHIEPLARSVFDLKESEGF